jgi:hypothetical protein
MTYSYITLFYILLNLFLSVYIYRVCQKCVHILRDVIYVSAVVRRNQKYLDTDRNHFEHLL